MDDDEIAREIVDVLSRSPTPLKANDIGRKCRSKRERKDVNRVLHSRKHLDFEVTNPGQNPPLWRLKASRTAQPVPSMSSASSPPPVLAPAQQPSTLRGVASPGLHQGGVESPPSALTGGVASAHPPIGGVASAHPPIGGVASSPGQLYTRKDSADGSLTFRPVGTTGSPQVRPGHIAHDESLTTAGGGDVMPGHVTCSPEEETGSAARDVLNDLTSPPTNTTTTTAANQVGDFPPQTFPGSAQTTTTTTTTSTAANPSETTRGKRGASPHNLMSAAPKTFPSKEPSAKNSKFANQLERVANNSETTSSTTSPSSSKPRKTKSVQLAVKFPQGSATASHAPLSSGAAPVTANLADSGVSTAGASGDDDVVSGVQLLSVAEPSSSSASTHARILQILSEEERANTAEISRRLGMEGQTEELIYELMKLVEEGTAVKRSQGDTSYWSIAKK